MNSSPDGIQLSNLVSRNRIRNHRGSMLALIVATMGIVLALLFFGLNYVRLLGSNAEQKKAIESAALAAATDISGLVVNTDEFGYVSLSDAAPIGQSTNAQDQLSMPVHSINTIIGTARLDLIIADQMNDDTMRQFAILDANNAQKAAKTLVTALNAAILPGGKVVDKDGKWLYPYIDAINAYTANDIRMTGASFYVPDSMKLTLGTVTGGIATNTPVPQPAASAVVPPDQQVEGFYRSDMNIKYLAQDFVFASVGKSSTLADPKLFVAGGDTTLPYCIPAVVKAEANQFITTSMNGDQVHAVACGVPSSLYDPLPAPGSLSLSFPDGPVPEIKTLSDIFNTPQLNDVANQSTLLTPVGGDFPWDSGSSMSPMSWPLNNAVNPPIGVVFRGAFYDWIRRAGCRAQINQVLAVPTAPLANPSPATVIFAPITTAGGTTGTALGPVPGGIIHVFKFDPNGTVQYKWSALKPYPYSVSSNKQMYAESLAAITNSTVPKFVITPPLLPDVKGVKNVPGELDFTNIWDVYIRDEVRNPGTINGGKHGGEPMDNAQVAMDVGDVLRANRRPPVNSQTTVGMADISKLPSDLELDLN
ncbi:MAG: hypothetical protein HYX67_14380 [Candidatus Melainabacteria bacterium]|nr:hypothetical protein [Candidatus Melainabacteria bacterium]